MAKSFVPYKERIVRYCEENGVEIPVKARRHRVLNRFAVIEKTDSSPKLVPTTWFSQRDVSDYLAGEVGPGGDPDEVAGCYRVLDFERRVELRWQGRSDFQEGAAF